MLVCVCVCVYDTHRLLPLALLELLAEASERVVSVLHLSGRLALRVLGTLERLAQCGGLLLLDGECSAEALGLCLRLSDACLR